MPVSKSEGLVIEDLRVRFASKSGDVEAVKGVSVEVPLGSRLGIVGESGSGKSTLLRSVLGLVRSPGVVDAEAIRVGGQEVTRLSRREFRAMCGAELAMIFQDPVNALNPAFSIRDQFERNFRLHGTSLGRREREARILSALGSVGIDGRGKLDRYPFEFSQGQLQRIMIAIACISPRLKVLLADEPTSSLDVTTQAQVVDLLRDLQEQLGFALVLVTHNLPLVAELCEQVMVMQHGSVVESRDVVGLFSEPEHPYTRQLLGAVQSLPDERGVA